MGDEITEEKVLQELKEDYDYIKKVVEHNHYSITWNELLEILNNHIKQGLLEDLPLAEGEGIDELIYAACSFNDLEFSRWLVNNGADVNCCFFGNTPLLIAAQHGNKELVKLLIDSGADIDDTDPKDNTPLHLAVKSNNQECVLLLAKKGYDMVHYKNYQEEIPLHLAACNGNLECIKLVATKFTDKTLATERNIDNQNIEGETALHLTAKNGHNECVKFLMQQGIDYKMTNNSGDTALQSAIKNWNYQCISQLIQYMDRSSISNKNKEGKTALYLVIESNIDIWIEKREILILLLEKSDDAAMDKAYRCAKDDYDLRILKVFQNHFLKQKKDMERKSLMLERQESWSRDYILYVANIAAIITSILVLVKETQKYSEILNSSSSIIVTWFFTIIARILSLSTVLFMIYAWKKHKELDLFSHSMEECFNRIEEIAKLTNIKTKDDINLDTEINSEETYTEQQRRSSYKPGQISGDYQFKSANFSPLKTSKTFPGGIRKYISKLPITNRASVSKPDYKKSSYKKYIKNPSFRKFSWPQTFIHDLSSSTVADERQYCD